MHVDPGRPFPLPAAQLTEVVDRLLGRDVDHQHVEAVQFGHGGIGLVIFGLYSWCDARWRVVEPG